VAPPASTAAPTAPPSDVSQPQVYGSPDFPGVGILNTNPNNVPTGWSLATSGPGTSPTGNLGDFGANLTPQFGSALSKAIADATKATGQPLNITEGYRDARTQAQYYANYTGKPVTWEGVTYNPQKQGGLAAPPGQSFHQLGEAADLTPGAALDWLHQNIGKYPELAFLPGAAGTQDPVHIQYAGTGAAASTAGAPPETAGPQLAAGPSMQQILSLAANPWAPSGVQGVVSALLARQDPKYQLELEQARLNLLYQEHPELKPVEPYTLKADETRFGPGNVAVARGIGGFHDLVTPEERAAHGIDPADTRPYQVGPDNQLHLVASGGTNVSINQQAESSFEQEYGKQVASDAYATLHGGDTAAANLQKNDLLGRLMTVVSTGPLTPAQSTIGGWMASIGLDPAAIGIDPKLPATAEAVNGLANSMILGMIGAANGGFPANNFSEQDRKFLLSTIPQLSQQPGAAGLLLEVNKRINQLAIAKADAWTAAREKGQSYEKFDQGWRSQLAGQNIFADLQAVAPKPTTAGSKTTGSSSVPPGTYEYDPQFGGLKLVQ
jgi:hypothetical protein